MKPNATHQLFTDEPDDAVTAKAPREPMTLELANARTKSFMTHGWENLRGYQLTRSACGRGYYMEGTSEKTGRYFGVYIPAANIKDLAEMFRRAAEDQ